jgi:hypothetical protein
MSTQDSNARGVPEPPAKVVAVADQVASAVDTPSRSAMNSQIGYSWITPVSCGGPRRHS